jgi:hypothetical protein
MLRAVPRDRPLRVEIRGGRYALAETLVFGPEDSGTAEAPVTYVAYAGERPVISGGRGLQGWVVDRVNDRPCWRTALPEVSAGTWAFTQLFVNGVRRPRARFPKQGFHQFARVPDDQRGGAWYHGVQRVHVKPGDIQQWRNLGDVEIKVLKHWYDQHLRIKAFDADTDLLTFACPSLSELHDERGELARYTVENVFEALSEPGEWYFDRPAGQLYYLPMPGETLETVTLIAPRLDALVRLAGTPVAPVHHVRFEQLDFEHADWQLPRENPGSVQAAFVVPGAIRLRYAHDCALFGCTVSRCATYGVEVQLGSRRNRIVACTFHDLGAGGVKINHERGLEIRATGNEAFAGLDPAAMGWIEDDGPASDAGGTAASPSARPASRGPSNLPPAHTEVADCRIHDNGVIFNGAVGIWIGDSGFNHVHHNTIHDQDYTGISCGWSWSYAPTRAVGNRIEHNHVYNIGRGVLSDMGAIYLLGAQPGGVVRGNHVHHVRCHGYGGSGIYPDQGSSYLRIEDNVVHHTQSDALSIHYGSGLTVRNNVFALTGAGLMARGREESIVVGVFEQNLAYGSSPKMLGYSWANPATFALARNLYWNRSGAHIEWHGASFADWQGQGQDRDSRVADPLFVDPEGGDFSLRADSPALALGFRSQVLAAVGPRFVGTLPPGIDAVPRPPDDDGPILEPWLELGEPTFPTAADTEKLSTMPITLYRLAGEPQLLSLTLTNRGLMAARGSAAFEITPADAVQVTGPLAFDYALQPGERMVHQVTVTLSDHAEQVRVAVRDAGAQFPWIGQCITRQQDLTITPMPAVADVATLAEAMTALPARAVRVRGRVAGQVRMALVGDALALRVDAAERALRTNPDMPWMGSSLELFCESVESPLKVQQYFLFPADGTSPAGARRTNHHVAKVEQAPTISVHSVSTPEGYRLAALMPLALLHLKRDVTTFRFEVVLNTTLDAGRGAVGAKLFGGTFSWMGMDGWGTVHVAPWSPKSTAADAPDCQGKTVRA